MPETAHTGTILDRIVADTRDLLSVRMQAEPLIAMRNRAEQAPQPAPFAAVLRGDSLRLIAEVKKASPTKGLFDPAMDPVSRTITYASGGAAAISVLTEPQHFLGDIAYLSTIRAGLAAAGVECPPLLRKDFLFDPYQVYEARAAGADALLLIVAILSDAALTDMLALGRSLGLGVLVEAHDEREVLRALQAGAEVIGINNRDLRTFVTDLATTLRLRPMIPPDRVLVSESGISTREDAQMLRGVGVDAVLVGEALMLSEDVPARMRELMVS